VKKHALVLHYLDELFSGSFSVETDNAESVGSNMLEAAKKYARQKVVVKRAPKAPWLGNQKPSSCLQGKSIRFDIYVCS
jgi:hypothetical protein